MAKELPYFKFEPNQWENGNIQMFSRADKGLFIDLCSMYWSRIGNVPLKLAIQKLCDGNATALNPLCDEKIIEVIDGNIYIKFLSEQLLTFKDVSQTNSKNAKDRWEKARKQKEVFDRNATALDSQCESDTIREEEIREEEIKEDEEYVKTHTIHSFEHLSINNIEFDKLEKIYSSEDIFDCFDKIQNYKQNKKYKSLYLTAKIWLKKDYQTKKENSDLPEDLNINFKMLLEWFNEMIEPDIILTQVPEPTKKRYLNLLQSGFTKLHIETAIVNARRDRESFTNCTIDTFSYLPMLNKYQKDVSRIGAL
jgi:hypothetical protein